jgi:NAD(P)-dependent dehydrogenase (short-subunit alcohol dehydrogenase family)
LLARGADGLQGARNDVERLGGQVVACPVDVCDPEAIERAAQLVESTFGEIDVWINNAMVSVFSPVKEMQADEYKRVTEVTYLGVVYGTLTALRRMLPRNHGTVVQVGSALAYRGIPLQSAYCGAKHAIQGFTESLRCELLHDRSNVRVTMVQLPALNTPQFSWIKSRLPKKPQPVPPIYQPEVAADAIFYAASHARRREIEVGLSTVIAIEGNKRFPGLLDHYLARTNYEAQQTSEPVEPYRTDNLWAPVSGDHGAHGPFDGRAYSHSLQVWADRNRPWLAFGLGACLFAGILMKKTKQKAA